MGHTILIVEDDQHFAAQLKELFEFHGHEPRVATTGPDGIAAFKSMAPDLVIIDVMLPQVHGIRVLEEIRVAPGGRDVPALLMSAVYKNESLFARDMKRLGVTSFLSKPFSVIDLGRKVNGILASEGAGRAATRAIMGLSADQMGAARAPNTGTHYSVSSGSEPPRARPDWDLETGPTRAIDASDVGRPAESDRTPVGAPSVPGDGELDPGRYVGLLTHLFHGHSSGLLVLHTPASDTGLYFLNGYPVWVDAEPRALLSWLEDEGHISDAAARSVEPADGTDWNPVRVLVERRLLTADVLPTLMEAWVASEVRAGIHARGRYSFEATDEFAGMIPVYEVNPIREVWAAVAELPLASLEADLAERAASRTLGRTRTFNRLFGYVATTPTLRALGECLLRPRTLAEISARFGTRDEDTTRCLWLLIHAGLVALADAPPAPKEAPASRSVAPEPAVSRAQATEQSRFETRRFAKSAVDELRRAGERGADDTAEARVARDYVTRMELDHYAFLDVEPEATMDEIDAAYRRLAPAYRLRNLGTDAHGDTRRQAKELLARLVQAFEDLSDPARRQRYDVVLDRASAMGRRPARAVSQAAAQVPRRPASAPSGAGASHDPLAGYPSADSDRRVAQRAGVIGANASAAWGAARSAMGAGEFRRAFALLERLRLELPSEPGVLADLAWCRLNLGPTSDQRSLEKALEWIQLAEAFERAHPDVIEVRARVMVHSEDRQDALVALRRLAKSRADLTWVASEIARRESEAAPAQPEGGGILSGLFSRGKGGRR